MVFIDTHVALWLFAEPNRVPSATQQLTDQSELFVSPMVRLERDLGVQLETAGWLRAAEIESSPLSSEDARYASAQPSGERLGADLTGMQAVTAELSAPSVLAKYLVDSPR